jgi:hypothetical protein
LGGRAGRLGGRDAGSRRLWPHARRGAYRRVLVALAVFSALIHFQVSIWRQAAALLLDEDSGAVRT